MCSSRAPGGVSEDIDRYEAAGCDGKRAAFLVGVAFLSRAGIALQRATSGDDIDLSAARAALSRWILGYRVLLAVLVLVFWDMVFKPGL